MLFGGRSMSPITTAKQKSSSFRPQGTGNAVTNSASRSPARALVDTSSHAYKNTDPKSAVSYNKAQLKTK